MELTYSVADKIKYYAKRINDQSLTARQRGYAEYRISILQNKKTINKENKNHLKKEYKHINYEYKKDFNPMQKMKYFNSIKTRLLNDFFETNYVFEGSITFNPNQNKAKYLVFNEDDYFELMKFFRENKEFQKAVFKEQYYKNLSNKMDRKTAREKAVEALKHELGAINTQHMSMEDIFDYIDGK